MQKFKNLRNSEKNLIYVLSLLVILLIYSKFFRNPSIEHQTIEERHINTSFTYDDSDKNQEISALNNDELNNKELSSDGLDNGLVYQYESNPNYQRAKALTESFGKKFNLLALAEENNLDVTKYDVKPTQEGKIGDVDYYYIDTNFDLIGDKSNIDSFLSAINSIKELYIERISMKFDGDNTDLNLTLREYSIEKVVFPTNDNVTYDNPLNATNINPPVNYSFPEYRPSVNPDSNIIVESKELTNNEINTPVINAKKEENVNEEGFNNKLEEDKKEDSNIVSEKSTVEKSSKPNFSRVDAVNKLSNKGGRHLVTSKYVEDNYSFLKGKSNINSFNDPNYIGDFEFVFLGNLSLASSPLYLVNGEKNVGVSVYGGNNVTIYLKDNAGNEVFLTQTKSGSGYENIKFELPSDLSYPVKITSINVSGGGGSNAKAKNFVAF